MPEHQRNASRRANVFTSSVYVQSISLDQLTIVPSMSSAKFACKVSHQFTLFATGSLAYINAVVFAHVSRQMGSGDLAFQQELRTDKALIAYSSDLVQTGAVLGDLLGNRLVGDLISELGRSVRYFGDQLLNYFRDKGGPTGYGPLVENARSLMNSNSELERAAARVYIAFRDVGNLVESLVPRDAESESAREARIASVLMGERAAEFLKAANYIAAQRYVDGVLDSTTRSPANTYYDNMAELGANIGVALAPRY